MSNIVPFIFESHQVRVLTDADGRALFVAKDVAEALGYKDPATAVRSHCRGEHELLPIVDALGRAQEARGIREPDVYRLIFGSTLPSAQGFERLVVEEILPTIRKTGQYVSPASQPLSLAHQIQLDIARAAQDMLRMSATSSIRMLSIIAEEHHVSGKFLPGYVSESLVKAIGTLLKEHGSSLSAISANKILLRIGILEELSRPSSNGGVKYFKSLTSQGLAYGRNDTSPKNERETHPLYYADRFQQLLDLINSCPEPK